MLWRVIVASIVVAVVPFVFRVLQIGTLLAAPFLLLVETFYRKAKSAKDRASLATFAYFFANLFANAAGMILALLIVRHLPLGYYWLLAGLVALEALLIAVVLADWTPSNPPIPLERTMIFFGAIASIPIFYPLALKWLTG